MTVRKFLIMPLAACATVSAATAAVAQTFDAGPTATVPLASSALRSLASKMSVLTDGTEPLRDVGAVPVTADDVVDLRDARQLTAQPDSILAPTTDGSGLCVAGPGRMACATVEALTRRGAAPAFVWNAAGDVHLFGLTTDEVEAVTAVYRDGREETVPARDNVLDADLTERPVSIRWQGPDGAESVETAKQLLPSR